MVMTEAEEIRQALSYVSAEDRDTWVRMCFAVKSSLGDDGFYIWDEWSRSSENYQELSAKSTWRSAREDGSVTASSLFKLARNNGWNSANRSPARPILRSKVKNKDEARERLRRCQNATSEADRLCLRAEIGFHPYLIKKGLPSEQAMVLDGELLVPMAPFLSLTKYRNVQRITPDGGKKFLYGGKVSGMVYQRGKKHPQIRMLCEGYATAITLLDVAAAATHQKVAALCCFNANNMIAVARQISRESRVIVVADYDRDSSTGQQAAEKTGLPYILPAHNPEYKSTDYNDWVCRDGCREEAIKLLREKVLETPCITETHWCR